MSGTTAYIALGSNLGDRRRHLESALDDLAQLKVAVEWQKRWYLSTSDWDTEHEQEKDYKNRNHRIKRWLKRIKPYRYGDNVNGSSK